MELNGWTSPQMHRRYGASVRARRSYDRIMDDAPLPKPAEGRRSSRPTQAKYPPSARRSACERDCSGRAITGVSAHNCRAAVILSQPEIIGSASSRESVWPGGTAGDGGPAGVCGTRGCRTWLCTIACFSPALQRRSDRRSPQPSEAGAEAAGPLQERPAARTQDGQWRPQPHTGHPRWNGRPPAGYREFKPATREQAGYRPPVPACLERPRNLRSRREYPPQSPRGGARPWPSAAGPGAGGCIYAPCARKHRGVSSGRAVPQPKANVPACRTVPITMVAYSCLYIAIPRTEQFRGSESTDPLHR